MKRELSDYEAAEYFRDNPHLVYRDGDKWCATFHTFQNLAISRAGFGDTREEAIANLLKETRTP